MSNLDVQMQRFVDAAEIGDLIVFRTTNPFNLRFSKANGYELVGILLSKDDLGDGTWTFDILHGETQLEFIWNFDEAGDLYCEPYGGASDEYPDWFDEVHLVDDDAGTCFS
jgi:hypothetical protein